MMNDRLKPILYAARVLSAAIAILTLTQLLATADVVGKLKFTVKDGADKAEKPIFGAKIVLHDSAGQRPDITLTTDDKGVATTPLIENRAWRYTAEAGAYKKSDLATVTVLADTTTDVEVFLDPLKEKTIVVHAPKELTSKGDTSSATNLTAQDIARYPTTAQNPQQLQNLLTSTPGFVMDSNGQAHPRGEHQATTLFINGFELPDVLMGRAGALLIPDTFQNLEIMTGGYAPEYGGETAAILNVTLKSGTITPFANAYVEGGSWNTWDGGLSFGGQGGRALGTPSANGAVARAFGYFVDINMRTTDNAVQPPQPGDQTANNHGESQALFGNFTYKASSNDDLTLTLNSAPAYTQIADRTGLADSFAPFGQGYGFGGERDRFGNIASGLSASNTGVLGTGTELLASQYADGQSDYQRDVNDLGVLSWRHTLSKDITSLFSVSMIHSGQSILNNNPGINLANLPVDNSIEFNPSIVRNYHHEQAQGSITYAGSQHNVKIGGLYDNEEGDETYQLIPGSQLALDAIATLDPLLAPAGSFKNATDVNGYGVYNIAGGAASPVLHVHRTGYYAAAYAQDTWQITKKFTANYGLRLDSYRGEQNVPGQTGVDTTDLSPRLNLSYQVLPKTVLRASANRLFIQPPLAQGEIVGQAIQPELVNQYDFSVERQIARNQKLKLAYYAKNMKNQIDTGLLIPNTQLGVYSAVNFSEGNVHGTELSWDLTPKNNVGLGAFATWTNSLAKPGGVIDGVAGAAVPVYNDHDQLNTVATGLEYTWKSGYNVSMDFYFGSGNGSSGLAAVNTANAAPRSSNEHLNLVLSSGPGLFGGGPKNGRGGLSLVVVNLFNDTSIINYNSGFSGTRFDQGRTVLLQAFGRF